MPTQGESVRAEIGALLFKLKKLQVELGGGKENGKGKEDSNKGGDRFMDIKASMSSRLARIKKQLEEKNNSGGPRDIIGRQQAIRDEIRALQDEWKELSNAYSKSMKKKNKARPHFLRPFRLGCNFVLFDRNCPKRRWICGEISFSNMQWSSML